MPCSCFGKKDKKGLATAGGPGGGVDEKYLPKDANSKERKPLLTQAAPPPPKPPSPSTQAAHPPTPPATPTTPTAGGGVGGDPAAASRPQDDPDKANRRRDVVASFYSDQCELIGFKATGSRPPSAHVGGAAGDDAHDGPAATSSPATSSPASTRSGDTSGGAACRADLAEKRREFFRPLTVNLGDDSDIIDTSGHLKEDAGSRTTPRHHTSSSYHHQELRHFKSLPHPPKAAPRSLKYSLPSIHSPNTTAGVEGKDEAKQPLLPPSEAANHLHANHRQVGGGDADDFSDTRPLLQEDDHYTTGEHLKEEFDTAAGGGGRGSSTEDLEEFVIVSRKDVEGPDSSMDSAVAAIENEHEKLMTTPESSSRVTETRVTSVSRTAAEGDDDVLETTTTTTTSSKGDDDVRETTTTTTTSSRVVMEEGGPPSAPDSPQIAFSGLRVDHPQYLQQVSVISDDERAEEGSCILIGEAFPAEPHHQGQQPPTAVTFGSPEISAFAPSAPPSAVEIETTRTVIREKDGAGTREEVDALFEELVSSATAGTAGEEEEEVEVFEVIEGLLQNTPSGVLQDTHYPQSQDHHDHRLPISMVIEEEEEEEEEAEDRVGVFSNHSEELEQQQQIHYHSATTAEEQQQPVVNNHYEQQQQHLPSSVDRSFLTSAEEPEELPPDQPVQLHHHQQQPPSVVTPEAAGEAEHHHQHYQVSEPQEEPARHEEHHHQEVRSSVEIIECIPKLETSSSSSPTTDDHDHAHVLTSTTTTTTTTIHDPFFQDDQPLPPAPPTPPLDDDRKPFVPPTPTDGDDYETLPPAPPTPPLLKKDVEEAFPSPASPPAIHRDDVLDEQTTTTTTTMTSTTCGEDLQSPSSVLEDDGLGSEIDDALSSLECLSDEGNTASEGHHHQHHHHQQSLPAVNSTTTTTPAAATTTAATTANAPS